MEREYETVLLSSLLSSSSINAKLPGIELESHESVRVAFLHPL